MNEIKEALDRAAKHVAGVRASEHQLANDYAIKQTLLALVDAVAEIAAVLPAPHTVTKDDEPIEGEM